MVPAFGPGRSSDPLLLEVPFGSVYLRELRQATTSYDKLRQADEEIITTTHPDGSSVSVAKRTHNLRSQNDDDDQTPPPDIGISVDRSAKKAESLIRKGCGRKALECFARTGVAPFSAENSAEIERKLNPHAQTITDLSADAPAVSHARRARVIAAVKGDCTWHIWKTVAETGKIWHESGKIWREPGRIWQNLAESGRIWQNLDAFWQNLAKSGRIWHKKKLTSGKQKVAGFCAECVVVGSNGRMCRVDCRPPSGGSVE